MKTVFISLFIGALIIVSYFVKIELSLVNLAVLGLATIRMARTISFNGVGEPLRKWFTKTTPDNCNAGENVEPAGTGLCYAIGELISCPICSGTWSALVMVVLWAIAPVAVYVFAVASVSEALHWAYEFLEWRAREARVMSGLISPDNKADQRPIALSIPTRVSVFDTDISQDRQV